MSESTDLERWGNFAARIFQHLPPTIDREKTEKQIFYALRANLQLGRCSIESWAVALMRADQLGLEPGLHNEFWLIPRNMKQPDGSKRLEITWQIGYAGYVKMAMRSGQYSRIAAQAVYEGDHFEIDLAMGTISHSPTWTGRGPMLGVYSVSRTVDGVVDVELMIKDEIESVRKRSASSKGPWSTDYSEMARKTVLKRHCKRLELAVKDRRAMYEEDNPAAVSATVREWAQPAGALESQSRALPEPPKKRSGAEADRAGLKAVSHIQGIILSREKEDPNEAMAEAQVLLTKHLPNGLAVRDCTPTQIDNALSLALVELATKEEPKAPPVETPSGGFFDDSESENSASLRVDSLETIGRLTDTMRERLAGLGVRFVPDLWSYIRVLDQTVPFCKTHDAMAEAVDAQMALVLEEEAKTRDGGLFYVVASYALKYDPSGEISAGEMEPLLRREMELFGFDVDTLTGEQGVELLLSIVKMAKEAIR